MKHGYDEQFGARPLKRAIQRYIEDPLSEKILLGEFSKGDEIEVDVVGRRDEARVPGPVERAEGVERSASGNRRRTRPAGSSWDPAGLFSCILPHAMRRLLLLAVALLCWRRRRSRVAQDTAASGRCATPDTIAVRGNDARGRRDHSRRRRPRRRDQLNYRDVQRAITAILRHRAVRRRRRSSCELDATAERRSRSSPSRSGRCSATFDVDGRGPGLERIGPRPASSCRSARPLDPARGRARGRSASTRSTRRTATTSRACSPRRRWSDGSVSLTFRVDEGRRLAVSGVSIDGNTSVSATTTIVGAMQTQARGIPLVVRKGEFDDDKYAADLGERIPALYASRGFIDFAGRRRTRCIVDREHGKALVELTVAEGPQYRIGEFEVTGNRRFSTEEIARFYPFDDDSADAHERVTGVVCAADAARRDGRLRPGRVGRGDATACATAYAQRGVHLRRRAPGRRAISVGADSIADGRTCAGRSTRSTPAIVNRIEIVGNDYTTESCIRDQLVIVPGDVFNQRRADPQLSEHRQPRLLRDAAAAAGHAAGERAGRHRHHLPREGEAHGQRELRRVGGSGHGRRRLHRLRPAEPVRPVQARLAAVAVRPLHQRLQPDVQRSAHPRVAGLGHGHALSHRRRATTSRDLGRSIATGGQLQVGFPCPARRSRGSSSSYGGEARELRRRRALVEPDQLLRRQLRSVRRSA